MVRRSLKKANYHSLLAAAALGTCMTLSSWATSSIEDVCNAAPEGLRWFQLYIYKDENIVIDLVNRAEKAGFTALAVTVDTPILGQRRKDVRYKFSLPAEFSLANYPDNVAHSEGVKSESDSGLAAYVKSLINPSLSWKHIEWLRSITKLKILVKGVMTKEAAIEAVEHGVDGIIVSNHGARQIDGVTSTVSFYSLRIPSLRSDCITYYPFSIAPCIYSVTAFIRL